MQETILRRVDRGGLWGGYAIDVATLTALGFINLFVYRAQSSSMVSGLVGLASIVAYGIMEIYRFNLKDVGFTLTDRRIITQPKTVFDSTENIDNQKRDNWVNYEDIADVSVKRSVLDNLFKTGSVVIVFERAATDFWGRPAPEKPPLRKRLFISHVDEYEEIAMEIKALVREARSKNGGGDDYSRPWSEPPSFKGVIVPLIIAIGIVIFIFYFARLAIG